MTAQLARHVEPLNAVARSTRLRAALVKAFSAIGHKNGHASPDEHADLHLLYVYNEARSFFDKLYRNQLTDVSKAYELEPLAANAPIGDPVTLIDEPHYALVLKKSTPAQRLDTDKFVTELRRRGVSADVIEHARNASYAETKPARRYEVIVK